MATLTYLRVLGYVSTICIHVTHIAYMKRFDLKTHPDPEIRTFGALQLRYFTCWTFFLHIVYAFAGLTCDMLTLKSGRKDYQLPRFLRGFRDTLFSAILWPSTFLVFTLFWTLFNYDRSLILPEFVDQVLSRLSNHIIHTLIVPTVLWEICLRPRPVPTSHKRNLSHLAFHMLFYFSVLMYTYVERGLWIYPIFGMLYGTIYFPLIIVLILASVVLFYYMQWIVVRMLWGSRQFSKETGKRKVK